ncbi:MAG TPA: RraA family protein [bacterium]|nr:RraA family protein [bacterium]
MNDIATLYAPGGELGEALAILAKASPAWVSDAQSTMNTMDPGIKPVWPGARVVGPVFTARCLPESIITVHKALLEAPKGAVIVADGGGTHTGALFGELMATEARNRGIVGLIVDGAVRDTEALEALKFPVFARAVTPRVGSNRRLGTTQEAVVCGGVPVHPGDVVLAAHDGVVVVPRARLAAAVAAVQAIEKKEADLRARMGRGEGLAEMIGMLPIIYPK